MVVLCCCDVGVFDVIGLYVFGGFELFEDFVGVVEEF